MKTKVEELTQIEKETSVLLKELKPIVNDLFESDMCILSYKSLFDDDIYSEVLNENLIWGSVEYNQKLNQLIKSYQGRMYAFVKFMNVLEVIEKYKDCNSGILLSEGEKKRILNYTYSIFMINQISAELSYIIVSSN